MEISQELKDFNPDDLFDEYLKMQQLRFLVDHTAFLIMNKKLTKEYIERLLESTRTNVLQLFPDKEETYNMIYGSRFKRLIEDFQHFTSN
jgi:hypothetical protein